MKLERLGNIGQFINGAAFKPEDWSESGMKIIRIQNLTDQTKPFNRTHRKVDKKYIIKKGDVLVSWSATIGVFVWDDEDALLNQHIFKVVFDETKVEKQYFIVALKKTIDELSKFAHGSTMKHVVKKDFDNHVIPLPSLSEQIQIANILSKAENLIAQRKESIGLLDEFLKSTFLEMFGGIEKMKKMKPENLSVHIEFLTSGSRGWAKYYSKSGAKFLRIQNVWKGTLRKDELQYVDAPKTQESIRTRVQEGDLLITITADLGRTAVVPKNFGEAYINQHIALVRLKKSINPTYAAYYFFMPFGYSAIKKKNKSVVKSGLTFNDIRTLPIIIPPPELQTQFTQIVEKTEALKIQYQQSLQELENLYGSLSQKAFKGELKMNENA